MYVCVEETHQEREKSRTRERQEKVEESISELIFNLYWISHLEEPLNNLQHGMNTECGQGNTTRNIASTISIKYFIFFGNVIHSYIHRMALNRF